MTYDNCPGHENGRHIYDESGGCYGCDAFKQDQDLRDVWLRVTAMSAAGIRDGKKGLFILEEDLIKIGKMIGV